MRETSSRSTSCLPLAVLLNMSTKGYDVTLDENFITTSEENNCKYEYGNWKYNDLTTPLIDIVYFSCAIDEHLTKMFSLKGINKNGSEIGCQTLVKRNFLSQEHYQNIYKKFGLTLDSNFMRINQIFTDDSNSRIRLTTSEEEFKPVAAIVNEEFKPQNNGQYLNGKGPDGEPALKILFSYDYIADRDEVLYKMGIEKYYKSMGLIRSKIKEEEWSLVRNQAFLALYGDMVLSRNISNKEFSYDEFKLCVLRALKQTELHMQKVQAPEYIANNEKRD